MVTHIVNLINASVLYSLKVKNNKFCYTYFTKIENQLKNEKMFIKRLINCAISILLSTPTTKQYKRINDWDMQQHGWISKALCYVKEDKTKTTHCMILFTQNSRKTKTSDRKLISGYQGLGMREGINIRSIRKLPEVMGMFYI